MLEGDECLLPKGGSGICKSAFDCQSIRDDKIHENWWTHCNFDHSSYLICCNDPDFTLHDRLDCHTDTKCIFSADTMQKCLKRDRPKPVITPVIDTEFSFDTIFYTDEQCKALQEEYKRIEKESPNVQGVAHGEDAEQGEFPFMAVVTVNNERRCGATIITKR